MTAPSGKSKAVVAAEKASGGPRPVVENRWSKTMVARAVLAFNDIERIPAYDEEGIRRLVRDFLKLVDRVERGGVDDDALPLARSFIARGYQWLSEHPEHAPITTRSWSVQMVEQLILWWNEHTSGALDRRRQFEIAERLHTFERLVKAGAVESGEAEALAEAFVEYALRWLKSHTEARNYYNSL
jgi:hypothetical protein